MIVEFRLRDSAKRPAHHIIDVNLICDAKEGALAGLVIGNFAVWGRRDGLPGISVTMPAVKRRQEDGSFRFVPIIRGVKGSTVIKSIRQLILVELCDKYPDLVNRYGGFLVDDETEAPAPAA